MRVCVRCVCVGERAVQYCVGVLLGPGVLYRYLFMVFFAGSDYCTARGNITGTWTMAVRQLCWTLSRLALHHWCVVWINMCDIVCVGVPVHVSLYRCVSHAYVQCECACACACASVWCLCLCGLCVRVTALCVIVSVSRTGTIDEAKRYLGACLDGAVQLHPPQLRPKEARNCLFFSFLSPVAMNAM